MSLCLALAFFCPATSIAQTQDYSERHESARSDKFTGGSIERAALVAGDADIKITVNVPAFELTLWQRGKEIKSYKIGVGRKEFPIFIGDREATEIIWNPAWIPPDSDWVAEMKNVKVGEVIKPSDKRNPLGKVKIPLGHGYLIHQAAKPTDLGHLVSHGCIRMLKPDLYDLVEKITAARSLPITPKQIERAKKTTKTLVITLDTPLPVDINYDTQVVEEGVLHIYPDIYERKTNTIENLRAELQSAGVDASSLSNQTLRRLLARANEKEEYMVSIASIKDGRALTDGQTQMLGWRPVQKRAMTRKRTALD